MSILKKGSSLSSEVKLTRSLEDYLEAVYILQVEKGEARMKDLAARLNVKASSANEAVEKLAERNLVKHERYGTITLTKEGEDLAKRIYNRHRILLKFLHEVLGVELDTAEEDSCALEHSISEETLNKLVKFIERLG
ncbi:MAG: metal-dependent transcriptional regulator [Thermoprotei archaeon]|nr:MAG: metal-dependent transcriptional regulator [Thermoprotei archaeon]RLF18332.1 MAG: metal-dependent transcriptional regulator [Thermoprotei archaeon]